MKRAMTTSSLPLTLQWLLLLLLSTEHVLYCSQEGRQIVGLLRVTISLNVGVVFVVVVAIVVDSVLVVVFAVVKISQPFSPGKQVLLGASILRSSSFVSDVLGIFLGRNLGRNCRDGGAISS